MEMVRIAETERLVFFSFKFPVNQKPFVSMEIVAWSRQILLLCLLWHLGSSKNFLCSLKYSITGVLRKVEEEKKINFDGGSFQKLMALHFLIDFGYSLEFAFAYS
ncbi:hypothetical protein Nepgr_017752 [Nepenthes gracilis]|uniref:Uncharacterized protein n=1 Tax=Nepenthes gracilis TaxID=150966 RepID=A0AAD3SSL5_NEPGR|nr:hypothetical protein Nepgr_017752 [Nepenthes gracilis]